MPGTRVKGYELRERAVTRDEQMCGHLEAMQLIEPGMLAAIEGVAEELLDVAATELPGWQADVVDDEEVHRASVGARIDVGRRTSPGGIQPPVRDAVRDAASHAAATLSVGRAAQRRPT